RGRWKLPPGNASVDPARRCSRRYWRSTLVSFLPPTKKPRFVVVTSAGPGVCVWGLWGRVGGLGGVPVEDGEHVGRVDPVPGFDQLGVLRGDESAHLVELAPRHSPPLCVASEHVLFFG